MSSRLLEAARDMTSDFLAAMGTSLYRLGFIAAINVPGFFDAIYADALDLLPYTSALQPGPAFGLLMVSLGRGFRSRHGRVLAFRPAEPDFVLRHLTGVWSTSHVQGSSGSSETGVTRSSSPSKVRVQAPAASRTQRPAQLASVFLWR